MKQMRLMKQMQQMKQMRLMKQMQQMKQMRLMKLLLRVVDHGLAQHVEYWLAQYDDHGPHQLLPQLDAQEERCAPRALTTLRALTAMGTRGLPIL